MRSFREYLVETHLPELDEADYQGRKNNPHQAEYDAGRAHSKKVGDQSIPHNHASGEIDPKTKGYKVKPGFNHHPHGSEKWWAFKQGYDAKHESSEAYLPEAAHPLEPHIMRHMDAEYRRVHPDLPREGNHHYDSARGHLRDNAYDHFHQHEEFKKKRPNLDHMAGRVLKNFHADDRAESRANERKAERRHKRSQRAPRVKKQRERVGPKYTPGTRKGIGSY